MPLMPMRAMNRSLRFHACLLAVIALLRIESAVAFAPSLRKLSLRGFSPLAGGVGVGWKKAKKADDDDVDQERGGNSFDSAFRQLENLESLGGGDSSEKRQAPDSKPIQKGNVQNLQNADAPPPEKEVQIYKEMVQEMEETDEEELYSDVLKDMGGVPTKKDNPPSIPLDDTPLKKSTEDFMNQALDEALKEVKVKNPSSADSILDDKEIMQEIEAIFERGNEQLMESLEDIRKEQQDLAKASAAKSDRGRVEVSEENAARLAQAEASMEVMLKRVSKETVEVEKAVSDLKAAQEQMDSGILSKLRKGGIPKQAAFVGLLLFSVRSIADSITAMNDESYLTVALIQGAVAIVCALIFFFL